MKKGVLSRVGKGTLKDIGKGLKAIWKNPIDTGLILGALWGSWCVFQYEYLAREYKPYKGPLMSAVHKHSCAAKSMEEVCSDWGLPASREGISMRILEAGYVEYGNLTRKLLGGLYYEGFRLTYPQEIKETLTYYGFEIASIKDTDLKKALRRFIEEKKSGIVWLKDRFGFSSHYASLPPRIIGYKNKESKEPIYVDIENYYGENTQVIEIMELNKSIARKTD